MQHISTNIRTKTLNLKLIVVIAFFSGFFCYMGMSMAQQDAMGLEKYIEFCRAHWVVLPQEVGWFIALAAIICAWCLPRFLKIKITVNSNTPGVTTYFASTETDSVEG
jgi:hypothetical protein